MYMILLLNEHFFLEYISCLKKEKVESKFKKKNCIFELIKLVQVISHYYFINMYIY